MSKSVFLDAGHGGNDPGASGNGIKEKDIVLDVTLKTGKILESHNVKVYYSRTTDKTVSLNERTTMANKTDSDVLVSIHGNSATNEEARGVETFSYPNSSKGKILAKDIQDSIINDKIFTADRGIKTANFHMLRESKMPSALVELGFISNINDAEILKNKKEEMAKALAKGILKNLGVEYKEESNIDDNKSDILYKVQVGAYAVKENAEKMQNDLAAKGFKGNIIEVKKQ